MNNWRFTKFKLYSKLRPFIHSSSQDLSTDLNNSSMRCPIDSSFYFTICWESLLPCWEWFLVPHIPGFRRMSTSSFQILFSSQIQSPPSKSKVKPLFFSLLITDKNKTQTFLQIVYNQNCSPICSILWNQEVNSQAKKKERVYTIRGGLQLLRKCTIKAKVITLSNDNKRTTSNEPIIAQSKDKKQALSTGKPSE